ncbi:hypothetical protein BC829DRAFT_445064 [Chytridium lagenaria]|nr:hypothetical protein BC829DRAFT_445064 [Chytridium lagenaria]
MGGGDAGTADQEVAAGIGKSIEGNVLSEENRGETWLYAKECLERLMELVAQEEMVNEDMVDHARDILQTIEAYLQANPVVITTDNADDSNEDEDGDMEM